MITIVLADDDFMVTETLGDAIPWNELDMKVVGVASNGKEALELCLELQPDILITDIQMPFYNGLEVAIQLQEKELQTKIVLISGVQDFDYARMALSVKAAGYILKPIQLKEVISVLKKVHDAIEMEFQRDQVMKRLTKQLSENLSLMRDKFLNQLVLNWTQSEDELEERIHYFDLPFTIHQDIVVAVAKMDEYENQIKNKGVERIQFYNFSIKNLIEQLLNHWQAGICFTTRDNEFVIILSGEFCRTEKMTPIFEGIEQLLHDFEGITLSIGIGNCVNMHTASLSYDCACHAIGYKFYTGNNSIIHINDIIDTNSMDAINDIHDNARLKELQELILAQIKMGECGKVSDTLEEYYRLLALAQNFSQAYSRGLFLELVINAYREICKTEGEVGDINASYVASLQAIMKAESLTEIKTHASKMLFGVTDYYSFKYSRKHLSLVDRIKHYVNEHYADNISLAEIANEVFMSPTYICAVFKRETNNTINEFIIETKMNAAKKSLKHTKLKVLEISKELGYENAHYFSYSFKKYTGETPQEYRNKHNPEGK
ncbi:response regulator [Cohnella abietis]|uniref:DNA-binding response regulator n=1 Tax=Cohnella abietis TaxID=2507935 RepID=A0A3T1DF00_9BACL|nr:response regulator [Cohnella abietis]BBI36594.1 hypothetical protein KCTCHS21_59930 [Cohnella abietis]